MVDKIQMMSKEECPWCHKESWIGLSEENRKELNDLIIRYRNGLCPECGKEMIHISDVMIKVFDYMLPLRVGDDTAEAFAEVGSRNQSKIHDIRIDLDETIGKLRDKQEGLQDVKKRMTLVSSTDDVLNDGGELREFIRDNFDEDDIRSWVDDEFGTIEIGPYSFDASDVIASFEGDFSRIAEETCECNYAEDRVLASDVNDFEEMEEDDVNSPGEDTVVDVAGLSFTVKWVEDKEEE